MDATINWLGRMSFSGTSDSGFTVDMGTDASVGGDNDGFRPLELMAISLGGCTSMDVMSILSKKRMIITGFEVKVHAERTIEHPMVFTSATIEYLISGHSVSEESVLRAIELSAVKYCPAQSMLAKAFPINLKYQIFEDVEEGNRELVS
ncbi:MAG: OsmC family protein, partial [Chloroflexota bacterium]